MRVTTIEQVDGLVATVTEAVAPEKIDAFLAERLTRYDAELKRDTSLSMRSGIYYLPYPFNKKLVGKLKSYRDGTTKTTKTINDEYGC